MIWHRPIGLFAGLSVMLAGGAGAQEAGGSPRLALELNRLEQVEASCRLTFLAQNQLGHDLDQVVLEAVLFDRNDRVERLSLLDLQSLPQAGQRVRQFDLAGLACADLGAVLINGVSACVAPDLQGSGIGEACAQGLELSSRVETVEMHQ